MRRPRLDLRPRWNSPSLPVIRDYTMPNGEQATEIDPEYERRYREHLIESAAHPSYKFDPTYNLRRKR